MSVKAQDRTESARRAILASRKLQRGWTAMARMMARNPKLQVQLSAEGTSCTDGKTLFIKVPPELGEDLEHEVGVCGQRDEYNTLRCHACAVLEGVNITVIHEVAHVISDTFQAVTEYERAQLIERAIKSEADNNPHSKRAAVLRDRIERAPAHVKTDYLNLSGLVSEYLPFLINAVEDIRVNTRMQQERPGTKKMFEGQLAQVFRDGVRQHNGSVMHWKEAPRNAQAAIGVYLKTGGYDNLLPHLDPEVVRSLDDPELDALIVELRQTKSVREVYHQSYRLLEILRRLGYMKAPDEPEDDPPPPPQESSEQQPDTSDQEENPDDSDESPEGEPSPGDGPAEEQDSPTEGGSSSDSVPDQAPDKNEGGAADSDSPEPEDGEDSSGEASDPGPGEGADDSEDEGGSQGQSSEDTGDDGGAEEGSSSESEGSDSDNGPSSGGSQGADPADAPQEGPSPDSGVPAPDPVGEPDSPDDGHEGTGQDRPGQPEDGTTDLGTGDDEDAADTADKDSGKDGAESPYTAEQQEQDGTVEDIEVLFRIFGQHDKAESDTSNAIEESLIQSEISLNLGQIDFFDSPSKRIEGVLEHRYNEGQKHLAWSGRRNTATIDVKVSEPIVSGSIQALRLAFQDNARGKHESNLRHGRVNARTLARRVPIGDDRIFHKKTQPGRKDYFVVIGLDCSGSTSATLDYDGLPRLALIKEAAAAKAEMLSRIGIPFAMYAHSGGGGRGGAATSNVEIFVIKSDTEPWGPKQKEALAELQPYSANLDGHTMEYYRKVAERRTETDKLILYYTDGAMPAANYQEELEILQREIKVCERLGIRLVGIGVNSDSPLEHGLDTILLDSMEDVKKVVDGLRKRLM